MEPQHVSPSARRRALVRECCQDPPGRRRRRSMSDFVLEITGAGDAITLEPIGCVDRQGAQTLLEAVESVQAGPSDAAPGDPHRPHHRLHRRRRGAAGPQRPSRPRPRRLTPARPARAGWVRSGCSTSAEVVVARDREVGLLGRRAVATRNGHGVAADREAHATDAGAPVGEGHDELTGGQLLLGREGQELQEARRHIDGGRAALMGDAEHGDRVGRDRGAQAGRGSSRSSSDRPARPG